MADLEDVPLAEEMWSLAQVAQASENYSEALELLAGFELDDVLLAIKQLHSGRRPGINVLRVELVENVFVCNEQGSS